ncbi:GNAT family N-acetyltransferase [Streptomyces sp. NPDC091292]|uniref:GNAT family N-acetyltransferase n=1 Tax=Streptomyces sp. NPDC091292 TaxID=3365991 RepID=UPI00382236AB
MSETEAITLRRAEPTDATAAAHVFLRSFRAALPTVVRPRTDDEVLWYFREVLVPLQDTWVAVADGEIVGVMALDGRELSQLYLAPEWRGQGIGDRFITLAKSHSPTGLTLQTFQINTPAHHFYERHGFTPTKWTDGTENEEREPSVQYEWPPPH